jgi:hypothetical protein
MQGTKGTVSYWGESNGGVAFYRRDELSVGKGSDPKSVRFLRYLGSVFLRGGGATVVPYLHFFFRFVSLVTTAGASNDKATV